MSKLPSPPDAVHSEEFLRLLMRRQLKLSVACAATFLIALLGMPLLNYFAPAFMATRVAGFTLELAYPWGAVFPVCLDHFVAFHPSLDCTRK